MSGELIITGKRCKTSDY